MNAYDPNNIFAKILRGDIPCDKVYEDDHVLAFKDKFPKRTVHVLIIPKESYTDIRSFSEQGTDAELAAILRAVPKVADLMGVKQNGFRLIANTDTHGGQEVPHLHFHLIGGEPVGPMVS
jgi:histidine triad (HIT) family protein